MREPGETALIELQRQALKDGVPYVGTRDYDELTAWMIDGDVDLVALEEAIVAVERTRVLAWLRIVKAEPWHSDSVDTALGKLETMINEEAPFDHKPAEGA